MNYKEQLLLADLQARSICEKCGTQMQLKPVPFALLEEGLKDLIIKEELSCRMAECPKCKSRGCICIKYKEA